MTRTQFISMQKFFLGMQIQGNIQSLMLFIIKVSLNRGFSIHLLEKENNFGISECSRVKIMQNFQILQFTPRIFIPN